MDTSRSQPNALARENSMTHENLTILIVDDEPEIADLYAAWLERDHEVLTAYGGQEALETIDDAIDIVLLDRKMPRMAGDEVLAKMRERGLGCRIVLMTAVDPGFGIIDMPFDEYLTKPVMRDEITGTVEAVGERDTDDESVREYHALVSKKATLEANRSYSELRHSDEYSQLIDRIEELAEQAGLPSPDVDSGPMFPDR